MAQSSSSAATLAEIVVLGRTPPLTAVAEYLHERGPYEVSQHTDASRLSWESRSRAQVFIGHAHEWSAESVERVLQRELRGCAFLILVTHNEMTSAWSSSEHDRATTLNPFLLFELNAAKHAASSRADASSWASLIDFVCTRHLGDALDNEELTETAWRVRRLALLAETTLPASNEGLHNPDSGRIDAECVAASLGISLRAFARKLGWNYTTVHKTPDSPNIQEALGPFARTIDVLRKFHPNPRSAREWLNTPHRELDERAPLQVMLDGRADAVRDMLEAAYLGLPT